MMPMLAMMLLVVPAAWALAGEGKTVTFKAGDEIYACACGQKCPCDTLSRKATTCACGADLVKAEVKEVSDGQVVVMMNGQERTFKTAGAFVCACGEACTCDTISQKETTCACGAKLKKGA
jgi:hypothetical protein